MTFHPLYPSSQLIINEYFIPFGVPRQMDAKQQCPSANSAFNDVVMSRNLKKGIGDQDSKNLDRFGEEHGGIPWERGRVEFRVQLQLVLEI